MAASKVLARDWTLKVADGLTWHEIGGITSFIFSEEKKNADTTDFNSNGDEEHLPASRKRTFEAEGYFLEDQVSPNAKARDAGQERVEELAALLGSAGIADYRLISPAGTIKDFHGSVAVTSIGGGNDDPTAWKMKVDISGAPYAGS